MSNTKTPPTRRALLTAGALTAAAAATAAIAGQGGDAAPGGPAILRRKYKLKMVTTWPKNLPGLGTGAERAARRITELTDGGMDIHLYAAGELVPAFSCFDAVASGKADIYHGAEYYWYGRHPAFTFFTAVPFGMTANEMNGWIYHGGGQQLWDELSARFGIKAFPCGNTGVQMGGWFKRELRSLGDLRGLRWRMPGLGGEVVRKLGATPVAKPGGELFLALSQGNIDATEWVGPWNDIAFGFHTIAPWYYGPGFHEPGAMLALGINADLWDGLPKGYKSIVEEAAAAEDHRMYAEFMMQNGRALKTLVEKHGVIARPFPKDILDAAQVASEEVLDEVAAHDPIAGKIAASFRAARAEQMPWTRASETAYDLARTLPPRDEGAQLTR